MITLFVIEDHHLIVSGIKSIFHSNQGEIKVIGSSQDVSDAITRLREIHPNIIILDLYLKSDNPVENIQRLRHCFPSIPIVILTVETSSIWKKKMFNEGAKAYLDKGDSKSTIMNTLIQVYQGNTVVPSEIQECVIKKGDSANSTVLTSIERDILRQYTSGYTLKEIAHLYGKSVSTLDRMLQKIRKRFHARNSAELVKILISNNEL